MKDSFVVNGRRGMEPLNVVWLFNLLRVAFKLSLILLLKQVISETIS